VNLIEEVAIPELPKKEVFPLVVLEYPDDMLKTAAAPWLAPIEDPKFQDLIDSMEKTLEVNHALGLAGPQVGVPYRIMVIRTKAGPLTMVNPVITRTYGEPTKAPEGCLSFPGLSLKVNRVETIEATFMTRTGTFATQTFSGYEARAVQHEIDHLNGVVFVDRIPKVMRSDAMKKWRLAPREARRNDARIQKILKELNAKQSVPAKSAETT
jgi:peptide deformylase